MTNVCGIEKIRPYFEGYLVTVLSGSVVTFFEESVQMIGALDRVSSAV